MGMLNKDRILANQLISDANQYLITTYGRSNVQQLTPASPFIQTLNVLGELQELNFQYIENSISELNFETSRNQDNIFGLSRLTGHNPTRGFSARGKVSLKLKINYESFDGGYINIPKYTKLKCISNNLIYLLVPDQDYLIISKDLTSSIECNIIEGTIETQKFTATGEKLQSFSVITKSLTDHYTIKINVNGETYIQKESLYDLLPDEKSVIVKTGINGGLDIYFGNGNFGYMPELGSIIEVTYLKTSGENGNFPSRNTNVYYEFDETGYNIFGEELDFNVIINISSLMNPNFGSNEEDINFTRLIAPYMSKNFVLLNPDNYYYYLKKFNYFSTIQIYNTLTDDFKDDDNIMYTFLIPDLKKKLTSNYNYFSVNVDEFKLTSFEQSMIFRLLNESGQQYIGSEIKFITPQIKKYVLNVVVSYYDNQPKEDLTKKITSKLNDYFINVSRRDIIPRSDIVYLLKSISGIDSANAFFVSELNEQAIRNRYYTKKVFVYNSTTQSREWVETKKVVLAENEDPKIGLNEFGDILIDSADMPIIRGGWTDSNNVYYDDDITSDLSGLNIFFKNSIEYNLFVKNNETAYKNLTN